MEQTLISGVCWVPRGYACPLPVSQGLSKKEAEEYLQVLREEKDPGTLVERYAAATEIERSVRRVQKLKGLGGSKEGNRKSTTKAIGDVEMNDGGDSDGDHDDDGDGDDDDDAITANTTKEEEEDKDDFAGSQFFSALDTDLPSLARDPFLRDMDNDSEDEDALRLKSDDYLLLAASINNELSTVEVYLYNEKEDALYVHHDFLIGAPPLAIEWVCSSKAEGEGFGKNCCAVGQLGTSAIEIWDLDVLDPVDPVVTLEFERKTVANKAKQKLKRRAVRPLNEASCMCLKRHPIEKHVLASGYDDNTVRFWDIDAASLTHEMSYHTNKVQSVLWHPVEPHVLLTSSFDRKVVLVDAREQKPMMAGSLSADTEAVTWDRHSPNICVISTEAGTMEAFDVRRMSPFAADALAGPLWKVEAHQMACAGLSDAGVPGMLVSCSLDGTAKLWNTRDLEEGVSRMVVERDFKQGPLFTVSWNPADPTMCALGGKVLIVWDVTESQQAVEAFRLPT